MRHRIGAPSHPKLPADPCGDGPGQTLVPWQVREQARSAPGHRPALLSVERDDPVCLATDEGTAPAVVAGELDEADKHARRPDGTEWPNGGAPEASP